MRNCSAYIFLLLLALAPSTAGAQTNLTFREAGEDLREKQVIQSLIEDGVLPSNGDFSIAPFDFNGDNVTEWVLRSPKDPSCAANYNCTFIIAGLSDKKPMVLQTLIASKIELSREKSYNIHGFKAYQNPNNDLESTTYQWNPYVRAFTP